MPENAGLDKEQVESKVVCYVRWRCECGKLCSTGPDTIGVRCVCGREYNVVWDGYTCMVSKEN